MHHMLRFGAGDEILVAMIEPLFVEERKFLVEDTEVVKEKDSTYF